MNTCSILSDMLVAYCRYTLVLPSVNHYVHIWEKYWCPMELLMKEHVFSVLSKPGDYPATKGTDRDKTIIDNRLRADWKLTGNPYSFWNGKWQSKRAPTCNFQRLLLSPTGATNPGYYRCCVAGNQMVQLIFVVSFLVAGYKRFLFYNTWLVCWCVH